MGLWASCLIEGTLCLALPCKGRAAGALLQMSPRLGQRVCAGDGAFRVCVCVYGWAGVCRQHIHKMHEGEITQILSHRMSP